MACRQARMRDGHSSRTPVARRLQQPTRTADLDIDPAALALAAEGGTPSLFGLAPGGVCRAAGVAAGAVRSYRTVSPLPRHTLRAAAVCSLWHFPWLAPAGRYPAPLVHGARTFLPGSLSASPERPSGRLTGKGWGRAALPSRGGEVRHCGRASAIGADPPRVAIRSLQRRPRRTASPMPSTRSGRKWRWNAVTTAWVAES